MQAYFFVNKFVKLFVILQKYIIYLPLKRFTNVYVVV